jgi:hypothetical protein
MASPQPTNARKPRAAFTLVELLMVLTPLLFLGLGVITAYIYLGRNLTRLGNAQPQDVKARRALFEFEQDAGAATSLTSMTTANLTVTVPFALASCATTSGSKNVTCTSTTGLSAGAAVWSAPGPLTLTNCTTTLGSTTVTCASTTGLAVNATMTGTGVPSNATVASITNGTTFTLSASATASTSAATLTASTIVNTLADGTTIASVTNGTTFVLSANASRTTTGGTLYSTKAISYVYDSAGGTLKRTDGSTSVTTTLLTNIDSTVTSPVNGFAYYNKASATATTAISVKAVEFSFTTKVGSAANGTLSSYAIVSPRVVLRNKSL